MSFFQICCWSVQEKSTNRLVSVQCAKVIPVLRCLLPYIANYATMSFQNIASPNESIVHSFVLPINANYTLSCVWKGPVFSSVFP